VLMSLRSTASELTWNQEQTSMMDYSDVWELGAVSDCCGAGVYLNGICADCNDHCTPVEVEEEGEE